MKAKFKLSQLALQDRKTITLVHPKHGDTGIEVVIAGPTNPTWEKALKEFHEKMDEKVSKPEAEESENDYAGIELYASAILGWDEEALEQKYSHEAALELLKDEKYYWLGPQIIEATKDHMSFFPDIS